MNTQEFDALLARAMTELQEKQAVLPAVDPAGSWSGSQVTGEFEMKDSHENSTVKARMEFVGTWSSASGFWTWAWGDGEIEPELRSAVEDVRLFGHREQIAVLTSERMPCNEADAVRLFAMALHLMKAEAPYRFALSPTSTAYIALFDVRRGMQSAS